MRLPVALAGVLTALVKEARIACCAAAHPLAVPRHQQEHEEVLDPIMKASSDDLDIG